MPSVSAPTTNESDLIKVYYEYAYLSGRQATGAELEPEDFTRLESLQSLLEQATSGDAQRRDHRRQSATLPVLLKIGSRFVRGTVLNISGGGMYVSCPLPIEEGRQLRATFGERGETQYIFSCKVVRQEDSGGHGLRFVGIPLEIRYGSYGQLNEDRERAAC